MSDPIMDILDDFDHQWRNGERPDLAPLIARLEVQGDDELCVELCAADLEWRWRAMRAQNLFHSISKWPTEQKNGIAGPRVRDYAPLLKGLLKDKRHLQRMLEAEFLARSQWGDEPQIGRFLEESNPSPFLESERGESIAEANRFSLYLAEQLDHLAHFRILVVQSGKFLLDVRIPPVFEIGRQDRSEPRPPIWLPGANRLLVATIDDRTVSRHQIKIGRTGVHEITLSNTSRNVALTLDAGPLRPRESTQLPTPVSITFADLALEIRTDP